MNQLRRDRATNEDAQSTRAVAEDSYASIKMRIHRMLQLKTPLHSKDANSPPAVAEKSNALIKMHIHHVAAAEESDLYSSIHHDAAACAHAKTTKTMKCMCAVTSKCHQRG
jgi:hypothetical protein